VTASFARRAITCSARLDPQRFPSTSVRDPTNAGAIRYGVRLWLALGRQSLMRCQVKAPTSSFAVFRLATASNPSTRRAEC